MRGVSGDQPGKPEQVLVYDFPQLHRARHPYGTYDVARIGLWAMFGGNARYRRVAVESIRRWWRWDGKKAYPAAQKAAHLRRRGGSNGQPAASLEGEPTTIATTSGVPITVVIIPRRNQQMEQD